MHQRSSRRGGRAAPPRLPASSARPVERQPGGRRSADVGRDIRIALGNAWSRSVPTLLTGILAAIGATGLIALPAGAFPVRIGVILIMLAAGLGLSVIRERPLARPNWVLLLCTVLILMPTLALQASTSREPFVSFTHGSAGPLLWLTFSCCLILGALWLYAAFQSTDEPGDASLLFLPAALLVPGALGAAGLVGESSILTMLAQASLVASAATFAGMLAPPRTRPIVAGVALVVQFFLLWVFGRGPVLAEFGGRVVPLAAALLLALAISLVFLAPVAALFMRRFVQTVEESRGIVRPSNVPPRGARRS